MPCYHPVEAYRLANGEVSFIERGDVLRSFFVKCGQCVGCRLERSRQWAARCLHEAKLYESNSFISLTYDKDHLPPYSSLHYPDFQKFMKRLIRRVGPVRFYMAGEYGEKFNRPHFHACLFGYDFPDKLYFCKSPSGAKLYRSALLERLWPFGFSSIGEVNFESAAYVARYIMKKITGDRARAHYSVVDISTGEMVMRTPEFNHMSLKNGGIGARWFDRYKDDWYPEGKIVVRGKKTNTPRYYDKRLKKLDPQAFEDLTLGRELEAMAYAGEQTDARLRVREIVAEARVKQLKRSI